MLLCGCYAVAMVPGVVAKVLLCGCYAVARVLGVVARVPEVVAKVLLLRLLWFLGWLLGCC